MDFMIEQRADEQMDLFEQWLTAVREVIEFSRDDYELLAAQKECEEMFQDCSEWLRIMRLEDQFSLANCKRMAELRHYTVLVLRAIERRFNRLRYD